MDQQEFERIMQTLRAIEAKTAPLQQEMDDVIARQDDTLAGLRTIKKRIEALLASFYARDKRR